MSQGAATRLRLISRRPVDRVAEARKRYGKPFAHERGTSFKWTSGPTILNRWLSGLNKDRA